MCVCKKKKIVFGSLIFYYHSSDFYVSSICIYECDAMFFKELEP